MTFSHNWVTKICPFVFLLKCLLYNSMPFASQSKQAKIVHVCQTLILTHYCRMVQSSFLQHSGKQWTNVSRSASYSTAHNIWNRKMLTACTEYTTVSSDHRKTRSCCLLVVNTTYEWHRKLLTIHTDPTCWMVRGSNPSGARFSARPDRPWGPPSLLYSKYRVFPGGKVQPGPDADHSPPSSVVVMEE